MDNSANLTDYQIRPANLDISRTEQDFSQLVGQVVLHKDLCDIEVNIVGFCVAFNAGTQLNHTASLIFLTSLLRSI